MLKHTYSDFDFDYSYDILNQHDNLLKLNLKIIKSFSSQYSDKIIKSVSITNFLLIINCSEKSAPDILLLISEEEYPELYKKFINMPLSSLKTSYTKSLLSHDILLWNKRINNINNIYNTFLSSFDYKKSFRDYKSKFNIEKACYYAELYALTPNPNYKSFDNSGGDCTNFVSQIIHAGGIGYSSSWKPYTHPWLRVQELYNYIISNNLGTKIGDKNNFQKGSIIQFYTPQKGYYFHSGFITYVFPYTEAFYCCHSYNKLNYPLSEIYPVIYPVIRCIALY